MNFTNEGGVCGTVRLLKNITGLWLLEGCRRAWEKNGRNWDWMQLLEMSAAEEPFCHLVDPDDALFVRPDDMTKAIDEFCRKTEQKIPRGPGAYVRGVLESLALKCRIVLEQLESLCGVRFEEIRVLGGGSQNARLNQFTADATGRRVLAGPSEATALGNLAMQMVATGAVASIDEARDLIEQSFPTRRFQPVDTEKWDIAHGRLLAYCGAGSLKTN
jgi:rhamnulokinase